MNKLLLIVILLFSSMVALVAKNTDEIVVVKAMSQGLSMACEIPYHVEVGEDKNFYFRCTVKNESENPIRIHKQCRLYGIDGRSIHKFLQYKHNFYQDLKAGESTSWLQHSIAPYSGQFDVSALIESFQGLETGHAPMKVSTVDLEDLDSPLNIQDRNKTIQKYAEKFPLIVPNVNQNIGGFKKLFFESEACRWKSKYIYGFRFVAPDGGRDLVWSFRKEDLSGSFFIVAVEGEIDGFTHFYTRTLWKRKKHLKRGDKMIVQSLGSDHFKAGKEYIIFFEPNVMPDSLEFVTFSVNFPPKGKAAFHDVFPNIL